MRDPYTVLSVVSAIASLLSIVFDVPQKVSVSLKTFILLLSIACALFFWIISIDSDGSKTDDSSEQPSVLLPDPDSPTDSFEGTNDMDDDSSTSTPGNDPTDDPIAAPSDPPVNSNILQISPLISNVQKVVAITRIPLEVFPTEIITVAGEIFEEDQSVDYEFVPQTSGRYRFEFSDVPDGTDLWLGVYNSGWEKIDSRSDLDNGDGLTVSLKAGGLYYLRVEQYCNVGTYVLNVGLKKPITDISTVTAVSDSIQYTDQQNDYSFSAALSGQYRFEFSDVPDGTDLWLGIYNSGWEKIDSRSDLDNGDGLTVSLKAGGLYYLRVEQYCNVGTYVLNVGLKKPITDISTVTAVSDSIQYTDQQNDYSFSAALSGQYRFEFSDVPDGTDLWLGIYNSGWEKIDSRSDLDNGDGLTVSLKAGGLYYLRVEQYCNVGTYVLNVGLKKPITDISTVTAVSDSIQYTDQQNDYSFSTSSSGRYRFEFSDVPDGMDLWLGVYNSGWEKIDSSSNLDNGDGLTIELAPNKEYFIRASYYYNYGGYTLNVTRQND